MQVVTAKARLAKTIGKVNDDHHSDGRDAGRVVNEVSVSNLIAVVMPSIRLAAISGLGPFWKLTGIAAGRKCAGCEASRRSDSTERVVEERERSRWGISGPSRPGEVSDRA
jgi:hypothetical protein